MALPTKNGRYLARVTSIVIEQKPTGVVQAKMDFACSAFLNGAVEEPCNGETIREWITIINKNGQPNEINVNSLRDSLGWEGGFAELASMDLTDADVQIVVADRTGQNGQIYKEVKYINPKDYTGKGPGTTDAAVVQDLDAKFGAMLRAMAPKPGASTRKASAPAGDAAAQGKDLAYREMMLKVNAYNREHPLDPIPDADANNAFKEMFQSKYPGKKGADLSAADWADFRKLIKDDFSAATLAPVPF